MSSVDLGKRGQIPTTVFVPPYPTEKDSEKQAWFQSVAGFCNGSQSVKTNYLVEGSTASYIRSIRTGNMVFMQGKVEAKNGYLLEVEILPVPARFDGFIQLCDSEGNIKGALITEGSKEVTVSDLSDGFYYVTGSYIANVKQRLS